MNLITLKFIEIFKMGHTLGTFLLIGMVLSIHCVYFGIGWSEYIWITTIVFQHLVYHTNYIFAITKIDL